MNKNQLLAIDLECALLEDVLHGQEGKAITHIRHLLSKVMKDESLPGSAGMREALESVLNEYVWAVKDSLKKIGNTDDEAAKLVEVLPSVIAARQALSSTGEEKSKVADWVIKNIEHLEQREGAMSGCNELFSGTMAIRFPSKRSFLITVEKVDDVKIVTSPSKPQQK